jgi:hypothetical protein
MARAASRSSPAAPGTGKPPREAGFGLGGFAVAAPGFSAAGGAVALKPMRLWRFQFDTTLGVGVSAEGKPAGLGLVVGRWR